MPEIEVNVPKRKIVAEVLLQQTPVAEVYFPGGSGGSCKDGYTPIKGVDYFTEADKAEMLETLTNMLKTETWEFVLEDGTLIEKQVLVK